MTTILVGDKPERCAGSFCFQLLSSTKARRVDRVYATFLSLVRLRYSAASRNRAYAGRSHLISSQTPQPLGHRSLSTSPSSQNVFLFSGTRL